MDRTIRKYYKLIRIDENDKEAFYEPDFFTLEEAKLVMEHQKKHNPKSAFEIYECTSEFVMGV